MPLPEQIGAYRIIRLLGIGGMGVVYEAEQARPKRFVALKVVKPDLISEQSRHRFEMEAELLGRLQHPGIAQIYEAGTANTNAGPQPYFAMELVRGQPLIQYANAQHLDMTQRLALFVKICDAVQYAHQQGIIHRDLKPANILLVETGQPKILDFGVAKVAGSDVQHTTMQTDLGQIIGTMAYMSPEQAAGDTLKLDTRSDVYALGVIAYELLSGKLPLELKGKMLHDAVRMIQEEEPSRLSALDHRFRGDLETIVGKALEKGKERRYQSASELAADIQRHLNNEPIAARPPGTWYQISKFTKRHKALVTSVAMVFVVLIFGIIGITVEWQRAELAAQAARQSTIAAEIRLANGLVLQGDALALAGRWSQAKATYWTAYNKFLTLHVSPSRAAQGLGMAFVASPPAILTLAGHVGQVHSVAFSPDGRTALSGSWDNTLKLWDLATGKEIRTFIGHTGWVQSVAFSPDGRTALSGGEDHTLRLWDLSSGKEIRTFHGHTNSVYSVAYSPDGHTALSGSYDTTLKLWDLATGEQIRTLIGHADWVKCVAFSPDGRTALSGSADNTLKLWDISTGRVIHTLAGHTSWVNSIAFSPDGRTALSGSQDNTLKLWDLATGKEIRTFSGHDGEVHSVAMNPDGRTALSENWVGALELWDLSTGKVIRTLTGHASSVLSVAISPDGRTALSGSADKTLKLWDLSTGNELRIFTGRTGFVSSVICPDGRTALSGSEGKTIELWDLSTGQEILSLRGHSDCVNSVAVSADGRTVLSASSDKTLKLWSLATGKEIRTLTGHADAVLSAVFSPDGQTALSGSGDNTLKLWDLAGGKVIRTLSGHSDGVNCVAFSPDGQTAVSGSQDNSLKLWNLATGKEIFTFTGHAGPVYSVAVSPDGRTALSGSRDTTLKLWDLSTGREIRTFSGHTDAILSVAFSPDGRTALSGSRDNTVKLWDLTTGMEIRTLNGHSDLVWSVAFGPDGRTVLSSSKDKTLMLWDFSRAPVYLDFDSQVPRAQAALRVNPANTAALAILGRWYAFRGMNALAVPLLENSRAGGAAIDPTTLARCYWELAGDLPLKSTFTRQACLTSAAREFSRALETTRGEPERFYLGMCAHAVQRAIAQPVASPPATGNVADSADTTTIP